MYIITKLVAGGFSAALTQANEVLIWGSGEFGSFATPQKIFMEDVAFADLEISKQADSFAAAVDKDGFMYTWG